MRQQDIEVERNESGVFAYVAVFAHGKSDRVMVWSAVGQHADEYGNMSDEDIQRIAFDRWKLLETSRLRRRKISND